MKLSEQCPGSAAQEGDCKQSGCTVTWLMDISLYLHILFSGRRCTCDWTHLYDMDLWQELDLLISFMMLRFFICVFWEWVGMEEHAAFSGQVSILSFLPHFSMTYCPLSYAHFTFHTLLTLLIQFPAPAFFLSLQTPPIPRSLPSQSCPCPLSSEKSLPHSPSSSSLVSCVPWPVSVSLLAGGWLQDYTLFCSSLCPLHYLN